MLNKKGESQSEHTSVTEGNFQNEFDKPPLDGRPPFVVIKPPTTTQWSGLVSIGFAMCSFLVSFAQHAEADDGRAPLERGALYFTHRICEIMDVVGGGLPSPKLNETTTPRVLL